ncbi:hypothetical protein AYI68_g7745 [Smittium mucronatum]|uniref:Uncharacterized protein n=1 Tax=Smittium mucronatum TaxID=133383 RepID=A0A1R0GMU7_9FUNG|nr:hypothetical protein AYI68_g7745 [Smittium mucronatum]
MKYHLTEANASVGGVFCGYFEINYSCGLESRMASLEAVERGYDGMSELIYASWSPFSEYISVMAIVIDTSHEKVQRSIKEQIKVAVRHDVWNSEKNSFEFTQISSQEH